MPNNVTFKISRHESKPVDVVEVMIDGNTCCTIYPGENFITVLSAHFVPDRIWLNENEDRQPPIPQIDIVFDPRPFEIIDGKLVRH